MSVYLTLDSSGDFRTSTRKPNKVDDYVVVEDGDIQAAKRNLLQKITSYSLGSLGHIVALDVMGTDASIVAAARQSYGEGTATYRTVRNLIHHLLRNKHTSPFEMAEIQFLVVCPMDVWRQWIRHRTANVNEYSTRYSVAMDGNHTADSVWRKQSTQNKQGSSVETIDSLETIAQLNKQEQELQVIAKEVYETRLRHGVAREQARKDLLLSTHTQAVWKIDLHNLMHFLVLRTDSHAQLEIRQFAQAIENIVKRLFPLTFEAYQDYYKNSITLTVQEQFLLTTLAGGNTINLSCLRPTHPMYQYFLTSAGKPRTAFYEARKKLQKMDIMLLT